MTKRTEKEKEEGGQTREREREKEREKKRDLEREREREKEEQPQKPLDIGSHSGVLHQSLVKETFSIDPAKLVDRRSRSRRVKE
jgi:hypothetical protein